MLAGVVSGHLLFLHREETSAVLGAESRMSASRVKGLKLCYIRGFPWRTNEETGKVL
jgi:hypothetical protein